MQAAFKVLYRAGVVVVRDDAEDPSPR